MCVFVRMYFIRFVSFSSKTNCFVILSKETLKQSKLKPYIKQSDCGGYKIRAK